MENDRMSARTRFVRYLNDCGIRYCFPDEYLDHIIAKVNAIKQGPTPKDEEWLMVFQSEVSTRNYWITNLFHYISTNDLDSKYDAKAMNWVANQIMMDKYKAKSMNSIFYELLYQYDSNNRVGIVNTTGQLLEIGDHVMMNIQKIGETDLDGVEFTKSGDNYWKYMNEHPQEVYEVVDFDFETDCDHTTYILSGAMAGNNWYSEELILLPEPRDNFEELKNVTNETAPEFIFNMIHELCEDGMASKETIAEWLNKKI